MKTSTQEGLLVVPSSPGSPPPGAVYSRSVPKSPGNPTPGWRPAGAAPKSPGPPPPGAPETPTVPTSPGPSPESYCAAWERADLPCTERAAPHTGRHVPDHPGAPR